MPGWRPVWRIVGETTEDDLLDALSHGLTNTDEFLLGANANIRLPPADFRQFVLEASTGATCRERRRIDILAAYGCESVVRRKEGIEISALCMITGQGHQDFLRTIGALIERTDRDDLRQALFLPWRYQDDGPTMRWDPIDDRRYAMRARNPSKAPLQTVRGANRLAIEALQLFPTAPHGRNLETTGFTEFGRELYFTWPLWETPVSLPTLRSLLAARELVQESIDRTCLAARGVVEVFRCRRITVDRFRNFTSAVPA
jgi:hypothetical protein